MGETIVVAGSLAQRPGNGGHSWMFLQYLLGFRRLGWDVLFIDRLEPEMCVDQAGAPVAVERSINRPYLAGVMDGFGMSKDWALVCDGGRRVLGQDRAALLDRVRHSALLLNVMGYLDDPELMAVAPKRVFLDIDPGFGQMWKALGLADIFAGHDAHVTIGENIGGEGCTVPTVGIDWITTKQPVVLEHWPVAAADATRFTSVASWRGPFAPIEFAGDTYGLRVHEFRRFVDLPCRTAGRFEVALDIDPADSSDRGLLRDKGWVLVDPAGVAADPWRYAAYIAGSKAEFMVAKNMYVRSRSGWFSDRSACYLASGRPVLAEDTGLRSVLPTGKGVVSFSNLDEAIAGVEAIIDDYPFHARCARAVAEEWFDSDVVLTRLLGLLGVA